MTAHLLTIGDEILIGQIVDTNSAWISRQLNNYGILVVCKSSVSDTREAIEAGVSYAASTAQIVIMTGGLGPTKDDVTKSTLANMFGSSLVFHQEVYDKIAAYFQRIGRQLSEEVARGQAMLPDNALVLPNKVGTASGMWFERDGKVFISLPGVPFEMEYLMEHEVLPRLKARFVGRPIAHRTLQTACEGESAIAKRIAKFEDNLPAHVKLAYLPSLGQVRLRLTGVWPGEIAPGAEASLNAELDALKSELRALLGDIVYGEGDLSLQEALGQMLRERGLQFGTAESCTGGYVAHLITSVPGSSDYFPGSVVSYSYEMKSKLLGVRSETLLKYGAVSEEAVREMAQGARQALGVDLSLSISGIAGPGGGTPDKPVGTVWMAVSDKERTEVAKHVFARDRLKNIQLTGVYALDMVRRFLLPREG
jgi:nicotinamide-nucleotide amidase